jgi:ADP-heptose:LPS heptosyltransferase
VIEEPRVGDEVLWMRFRAFGDVLQSAASAHRFKTKYPDVRLTFLTRPPYGDLMRMQPYIDEVIVGDSRPFWVFLRMLRAVRGRSFRWFFTWHMRGHASIFNYFSRIPHRIGESRVPFLKRAYEIAPDDCFHAWGFDIWERPAPALFVEPGDLEEARVLLKDLPERRVFAMIGSSRVRKMWPVEQWIDFLGQLLQEGWGVVLNGHGPLEKGMGEVIENALRGPGMLNLVDRLDFCQMAAAAQSCAVAVGNDTGPLHLSAVGGVPSIGLFSYNTSRNVGLRMPWFLEICADTWVRSLDRESAAPLAELPADFVLEQFNAFVRRDLYDGLEKSRT